MADPQVIVCESACTVTVQHEIPLLSVDAALGAQIGLAIVAVWALAFGFRMAIRALHVDEVKTGDES